MEASDWISLISVILAAIGGFFTLYQWYKKIKLKRSEYILNILEQLRNNEVIRDTIYMIEYSKEWYNFDFHNNKDIEPKVDYTLSFFSYICYLKREKLISKDEFKFLEYHVTRVIINPQVQNYLYNVYNFSKYNNTEFCFFYLKNYAEENNLLFAEFEDPKAHLTCEYFDKNLIW